MARRAGLRAGFAAKRASTVVAASLARDFAPARALSLWWACAAGAPPSTGKVSLANAVPKGLGPGQCVVPFDARQACPSEAPGEQKRRAARDAFVAAQPAGVWLRFTVDARAPRQVLLVSTPLTPVDPCHDFEEVTLSAGDGRVRRLALPLGGAQLEVWVPVQRQLGVEHAVSSAASEQHAIGWLRSREPWR